VTLTSMTLAQIEEHLAKGRIEAEMANGRFWRVRRNGRTQLWKTRPNDFRIPVKAGLKAYGNIRPDNLSGFRLSI